MKENQLDQREFKILFSYYLIAREKCPLSPLKPTVEIRNWKNVILL